LGCGGFLAFRRLFAPAAIDLVHGFAGLGSIGIQIGGIGALIPERRNELAKLGVRAMLTGTMANLILTVIAGMFWGNVRIQPERLGHPEHMIKFRCGGLWHEYRIQSFASEDRDARPIHRISASGQGATLRCR
jgi:hypothetical protein